MYGQGFGFLMPDTLRDYFNTPEEWEDYCRQYETWMAQIEGGEDIRIIKKKTTRTRCKACGEYMSLFTAHVNAISGHWHMKPYCLEKLMSLLEQNPSFAFDKKPWGMA